jgi:hypothetical protein
MRVGYSGADPEILENRVTHARQPRSAFDGYNRGQHWERTCAEVAKLRINRGARRSRRSSGLIRFTPLQRL